MSMQPGFKAAEARRSAIQQAQENSARYASSFASFQTTGWGQFQAETAVKFTTTFVGRPSVSHGFSLDGDTLEPGRFPRVSAGVSKWLTDERGFYIGAWLFFTVETDGIQFHRLYVMPTPSDGLIPTLLMDNPIPADPNYKILHDFTFTGIAMKSIPSHSLVELL